MRKPSIRAITFTRQEKIMEEAATVRRRFTSDRAPIDISRLLEGGFRSQFPTFDWIVGSDDKFEGLDDAEAYVDFSKEPLMVLREATYEDLYYAEGVRAVQVRFILAHEFGHWMLHQKSKKLLTRKTIGSTDQYKNNPRLEAEANIFAGSLLVPTTSVAANMDANTIALRYNTSQAVAEHCVMECQDYRRIKSLRGK
jgi:hypothetical protein